MSMLVSILIPAYNAEQWIAQTIESALNQTWRDKEIIILDDGSTDRTLAVARSYESRTLRVVTQANTGAAAARNRLLECAQGAYIQWLDADDLLAPDKVATQMRIAESCGDPRLLLSAPWGHFMYRPAAARFTATELWHDLSPIEWIVRKWTHNLHMQTATWLVSRTLSDVAGPWNTELLGDDDGEYFTRVLLASSGVRFVTSGGVLYRIVGTTRLSHLGGSSRKLQAQMRSMRLQICRVRTVEDSPRVHAAIVAYLQTWLPHFHPEQPDIVTQLTELAETIGGRLQPPHISWKYAVVDKLCGRGVAKRVQLRYNDRKQMMLRSWDRLMFQLVGQ
jgi:glycosyltransferase involved in cell wall biosynthesis